jgi:putative hydrolase of the HAD superfamily
MVLHSEILEFLKECRQKRIKICIISDLTTKLQFQKIINLRIENFIDFFVSSEEAGEDKPGKNIFLLALKKLNLNPDEVLVIGDSYEKDIVGARHLGIKAILFDKYLNNP